jgi:spermidine synthase
VGDHELMASGVHGSEDALAELACKRVRRREAPCVLIGGLGMGYTVAAALANLGPDASVLVAELVPAVVTWNRGPLAHLAGHPLDDPRVVVHETNVTLLIRDAPRRYDAVLLDVDNGPEALTCIGNDWLYSPAGLDAAFAALNPGGVLAIWSAWPDRAFTARLGRAGFAVEQREVRARGRSGGKKHVIWLAEKAGDGYDAAATTAPD